MEALPPAGSLRRRGAIGFFLLITAAFAYVLVGDVINWITKRASFPVGLGLTTIVWLVLMWRWILSELRSPRPPEV